MRRNKSQKFVNPANSQKLELWFKLQLYFALKKFCSENEGKCWGKRDCDDCPVGKRISELEEEIWMNF